MKYPRLGLVLVSTLSLVYAMPPETTTTRYTSYEEYDRFLLYSKSNSNRTTFPNLPSVNTPSRISDTSSVSNRSNVHRNSKQPKSSEFYNEVLVKNLKPVGRFNSSIEESRKLVKNDSDDEILLENYIENFLEDLLEPKSTLKVKTSTKLPVTTNKNPHRITTNSTKSHTHKISNPRVPDNRKNSSVLLNTKKGVSIVKTQNPFRLKVTKVTSTTKSPVKIKNRLSTLRPTTRLPSRKPTPATTKYTIKLTKKPNQNKPLRLTISNTTPRSKRKKPTVHKIVTKWSDKADLSEIKQNWYEEGVPYPNPNPEISSYSPPVSLNDLSSISPLSSNIVESVNFPSLNPEITSYSPPVSLSGLSPLTSVSETFIDSVNYPNLHPEVTSYSPTAFPSDLSSISTSSSDYLDIISYPVDDNAYAPPYSVSDVPSIGSDIASSTPDPTTAVSNPISVFNLDMVPDQTKDAGGSGSPCPSIHISSSLLGRQQRQECSDLSLVINSHIHQNHNGGATRNPSVSTYDTASSVVEDPVGGTVPLEEEGQALSGGVLGDPGVANAAAVPGTDLANAGGVPAAAAPLADTPAGGSGGTGGSGGSGSNSGNLGGFKFPDLKNLFDAIGYICNKLWTLLGFLRNPYLYIVPAVLFFALGFFTVLALFPWWIPILLLHLGVQSKKEPKDTVAFYKHVHRPVHHPDGWFWNHQTKSWQNVQDFAHKRKNEGDRRADDITELIRRFRNKYSSNTDVQSWKRRRTPT